MKLRHSRVASLSEEQLHSTKSEKLVSSPSAKEVIDDSDDVLLFKEVLPFSPATLDSPESSDDESFSSSGLKNESSLNIQDLLTIKTNDLKHITTDEKRTFERSPDVLARDSDLEIFADDNVRNVLEQLPDGVARMYCKYLESKEQAHHFKSKQSQTSQEKTLKARNTSPKNKTSRNGCLRATRRQSTTTSDELKCCNSSFIDWPDISSHLKRHEGPEGIKCFECDKVYKRPRAAYAHIKRFHQKKTRQCMYCKSVFPNESSLRLHSRTHTDGHRFFCTICKKGFKFIRIFMEHINGHTGLAPNKCERCGKTYRSFGSLREHEKTHLGTLPFKCSFCDKKFASEKFLKVHKLQHGEERKYKCKLCDKTFKLPQTLVSHLHSHSDAKPFKCSDCNCSYKSKDRLNRHCRKSNHCGSQTAHSMDTTMSSDSSDLSSSQVEILPTQLEVNKQPLCLDISMKANMETESDSEDENEGSVPEGKTWTVL